MSTVLSEDELRARLSAIDTTSLIDGASGAGIGDVSVLNPELRPVGPSRELTGRVVTADAEADLMSVVAGLAVCEPGDVLVIAAGGDQRAVAGELFGTEAQRRGVAGMVIDGRCRDSATLAELGLPVFARGVAPNAYPAVRVPRIQLPIFIAGVELRPGDWIRGDADGLVVGSAEAMTAALDPAEAVRDREARLRTAIASGRSLFEAINVDEHVAALEAGRESRLTFRELDGTDEQDGR